ncbi:hypothetical protein CASFOL_019039 [Castilleja foliolosa]|uniref:Uncharacterized protein n=1 Tax=Castilleja foliolosa TaxID=1961234 RepID=A0ABD3D392_9LAMI
MRMESITAAERRHFTDSSCFVLSLPSLSTAPPLSPASPNSPSDWARSTLHRPPPTVSSPPPTVSSPPPLVSPLAAVRHHPTFCIRSLPAIKGRE